MECVFKIIAFGKMFFYEFMNWFDLFIVIISIADWIPGTNNLSFIKALRLVRKMLFSSIYDTFLIQF